MEIKNYLKLFCSVLVVVFFLGIPTEKAFAANGTISITPKSANYNTGDIFNVSIGINAGTAFNAAKATVTVSPSISIQDIKIENCNFAFVKTPTQSDPSFVGVILGSSATNCTIYTLKLKAISSGTGEIAVFDAMMTPYKNAQKMPLSLQSGKYIISGGISSKPTPTIEPPLVNAKGTKLYNIQYTISLPENTTTSSIKVLLDSTSIEKRVNSVIPNVLNPNTATAQFDNVTEGVHTIETEAKDKTLSKQIVNVAGANRTIAFSTAAKNDNTWIWYALTAAILGCVGLTIIGILLYKVYSSRNMLPDTG